MKNKKTGGRDWKKGQSGNPAGRPKSGQTLKELLDTCLARKHGNRTNRQIIIDKLIELARGGDIRALNVIITWDEQRYQFEIRNNYEERLEKIESFIKNEGKT
jgi:hypothetical protein